MDKLHWNLARPVRSFWVPLGAGPDGSISNALSGIEAGDGFACQLSAEAPAASVTAERSEESCFLYPPAMGTDSTRRSASRRHYPQTA